MKGNVVMLVDPLRGDSSQVCGTRHQFVPSIAEGPRETSM